MMIFFFKVIIQMEIINTKKCNKSLPKKDYQFERRTKERNQIFKNKFIK